MRAAFYTLGCKVNQYETAAIMELFERDGFEIVPPEEPAHVYVVNSCTVTAESDKKTRQMLRRFRRAAPEAALCLCGCMPQAFPDTLPPEADIILGSRDRAAVLRAVKEHFASGKGRVVELPPHEPGEPFEPLRISSFASRTRAFVKIEDGCERFCSYCVIPRARGPVRSKPLEALERELSDLAASGFREIVLVGINLSSYGLDLGLRLLDAVRLACSVPGLARVRLGSLEPELLSDDDIAAMAALPTLCPQFHLSLQSGSDNTLRRMSRHYDTAEYRRIVAALRCAFQNAAVTTDIMVGFPGETDADHAASVAFAQEIGFARTHVFAYSRREGTPAAALPDQIPKQMKLARSHEMIAATDESRRLFLGTQLGRTASVLFETHRPDGLWEGYSENYTPVLLRSDEDLAGKLLPVSLVSADAEACMGSLSI